MSNIYHINTQHNRKYRTKVRIPTHAEAEKVSFWMKEVVNGRIKRREYDPGNLLFQAPAGEKSVDHPRANFFMFLKAVIKELPDYINKKDNDIEMNTIWPRGYSYNAFLYDLSYYLCVHLFGRSGSGQGGSLQPMSCYTISFQLPPTTSPSSSSSSSGNRQEERRTQVTINLISHIGSDSIGTFLCIVLF